MIIISYDIADDMIRLQLSVYEVMNTKRIVDNIVAKIEAYSKHFTQDDSVVIFEVDSDKIAKYGNAIHRDKPIVYF